MTAHSKQSIVERLLLLRGQVSSLVQQYPEETDFMPACAGITDDIMDDAQSLGDDDYDDVFLILDSILHGAGKIPDGQLQT